MNMKKKITKNLTEGNIYKNFLLYALPLIGSAMLGQAYSTVDGMIAGKFISEHALGAISATGSVDLLLFGLFHGFAMGFSIYVSHLFGKSDYATIKRDVISMVLFISAVTLAASGLVIGFRDPLMRYLKVDAVLYEAARRYFTVYAMGYIQLYV